MEDYKKVVVWHDVEDDLITINKLIEGSITFLYL